MRASLLDPLRLNSDIVRLARAPYLAHCAHAYAPYRTFARPVIWTQQHQENIPRPGRFAAAAGRLREARTSIITTARSLRHSHSMPGKLTVHNSLRPGAPVPFETKEEAVVTWYACGPTVYDLSHLGHARNYVSTDVIRRILEHYFNYKVIFIMNSTDIDDKIIIKARRQRLFVLEKKKSYTADDARQLISAAFHAYAQSNLPLLTNASTPLNEANYQERRDAAYGKVLAGGTLTGDGRPGDYEAKLRMHLANTDAAAQALKGAATPALDDAEEVLLPYLDSLYKETIDTSDRSIFTDLTQAMEREFWNDMRDLNVLPPTAVTRVTEYIPQIVAFVDKLIQKGFAYEAKGSVYFDIEAFEKSGQPYARLRPESKNDKALQEEGEGSLSKDLDGKKRPGDFALWKKSKPGEPSWESTFAPPGRPGWHIECSVMASDKLGEQMDVHSGGIDLAFPHHDNELAQSEAYFHTCGEHQWVRTFLHMGHLSIAGSKMSKSLKNFQTIKDALRSTYTPRGMRIVFLMGRWNDGVEISPELRKQAESWENTIDNFFTMVKSKLAAAGEPAGVEFLALTENQTPAGLAAELEKAEQDLDAALCNSFDTPEAMQILLRIVRSANIKMSVKDADLQQVKAVARWVTRIVGIFGLDANAAPPYDGLGWAVARPDVDPGTAVEPYAAAFRTIAADIAALGIEDDTIKSYLKQDPDSEFAHLEEAGDCNPEILALPYLRAISRLRDTLRTLVTSLPAGDLKQKILALADRIRDDDLTVLGVQLDDQKDAPSQIKFVPAEKLLAAQREKRELAEQKRRAKEEAAAARERAEQERWEKAKVSPSQMFRNDEGLAKYSEWDGDGVPTRNKDGSELPKSQAKKLRKEWERQKKAHDEWKAKVGGQ